MSQKIITWEKTLSTWRIRMGEIIPIIIKLKLVEVMSVISILCIEQTKLIPVWLHTPGNFKIIVSVIRKSVLYMNGKI